LHLDFGLTGGFSLRKHECEVVGDAE
jgi:hypothetical protein